MVVCKFFLQGTCKFGSMCKFDHEIKENYNPYQTTGTSILRGTNFGATPLPQPKLVPQEKQSVDTNMLIKSVVTDMTQAEKGGQWLFSCYAPFKEKPAFPGFEDQSFEELRHGYYEAAKAGSVEQFKQQIQSMVQDIIIKVRSLQNPSSDIISMLINIYNSPASPQAGVYTGSTQPQSTSNFSFKSGGISQQSTSIFGQANQNIFGNTQQQQIQQQNVFSPPANNNVFAGNNQNSQNIFGNQQGSNFGNVPATNQIQSHNSNIFAQGNNNLGVQNNSVFSNQPTAIPVNSNTIFDNKTHQGITNTAPINSGSIFGNNSQPPNANLFGTQIQQNNMFQPVSQTPNLFGPTNNSVKPPIPITQTGSIFNTVQNNQLIQPQNQFLQPQQNQVTRSSIFSQPSNSIMAPNNETSQAYSNSIFSNAQNTAAVGNNGGNVDLSFYSKLEELTEEEIKWFQSDDLDIINIPEKPPTYEMCFNS